MSDKALVERARAGDARALDELWQRHYRSGVRVARQYTLIAVDEVVAEAFVRCHERQLAGRGLDGAFRPLFYGEIRAVAGAKQGSRTDATAAALARTVTARAFESLPGRWQAVLWYLEVEGMDPHEAAPLLGVTGNSAAELLYRARSGMRSAWLAVYAQDAAKRGLDECEWSIVRFEVFSQGALSLIESDRVAVHLVTCARCAINRRQVAEVTTRLALVMIPLTLGAEAGGRYLGRFGVARAVPAAIDEIPPMPSLAHQVP